MENQNVLEVTTPVIAQGTHFRITQGRKLSNKKVILVNRTMEFTKLSKKPGFINGFLTNEKTGALMKTEISIPLDILEVIEDGIITYPEVEVIVA